MLRLLGAKPPRNPQALLRTLARNVSIDERRKQRRRNHVSLSDSSDASLDELAIARCREEESGRDCAIDCHAALEHVAHADPDGCAILLEFHAGHTGVEIGELRGLKGKKPYRMRQRARALFKDFFGTSNGRRSK